VSQGINEQIRILPAIESERHFFAVGLEMLRANFMPRSHDAALQERECGFNRIGVDVALRVDAELVSNCLVPSIFTQMFRGASVCLPIVREQNIDILTNVLADVLFECSAPGVLGMKEPEIAAALTDTDYHFFVVVLGRLSLPPVLTANIGFVHLDFSIKHWSVDFHYRSADSMAEIPCRSVASDSERALHLASGHAFLRFAEKQHGDEPFVQGKMAVIEYSSGCDGELVVAVLAVEQLLLGLKLYDWHLAAQTLRAFRPAKPNEQLSALGIGRKHGVYIN
jgi:hypothetical protein